MNELDAPILNGHQTSATTSDDIDKPMNNDLHDSLPVSPATPISNQVSVDEKIEVDFQEQESDARNEPLPLKSDEDAGDITAVDVSSVPLDQTDVDSSAFAFVASRTILNIDVDSIPPDTPMGTNEESSTPIPVNGINGINGVNGEHDVVMDEHTPATTPGIFNDTNGIIEDPSTAHTTPNDALDDDDDKPPPAKRPRMHSDADQASIAHVSPLFSVRRFWAC